MPENTNRPTRRRRFLTGAAVLSIAAGGAAWSGCGDSDEEEAADAINEATDEALQQAEEQSEEIQGQVEEATDEALEEGSEAQDAASEATQGGGGLEPAPEGTQAPGHDTAP